MSLETEVAGLTTATTTLLAAVNTQKSVLDSAVATATTKAGETAANATTASDAAATASGASVAAGSARDAAQAALASAVAVVTGGTGSLQAAPGKLPLADASGKLDMTWFAALYPSLRFNDIGVAGAQGFGAGICPALPAGFTALAGTTDPASANYGNYLYSDGSTMCWIPAFYFRLGNATDPGFATHGANTIRIRPFSAYPGEAAANADGFWLHRAFVNNGQVQPGFFRDKYDCSNNGGVASSIKNVQPMVSGPVAGQVGFAVLNGTPANAYFGAIKAARTRGGKFHPESVFQADALCRLSEAHAQAATSTTFCAWYDATGVRNYPKGNDNNALKSEADVILSGAGAVTWTTAGNATYPAFALAGSADQVAKTTHNGQLCGVTDVAGNIYKINPGMTSVASAVNITAATQTNPVRLTAAAHDCTTGDAVMVLGVGGMTQINDKLFTATVIDANTVDLAGTDGTTFGAFASGGTLTRAKFYGLKPSVDIATVGDGAALATDHWGSAGVAELFDELPMAWRTDYPNNGFGQRYGNGANAVFGLTTATGRARTMVGMPTSGGVSGSGSSAMGADWFYQYLLNQLCVLSRGSWSYGSTAGGRVRHLANARSSATSTGGFAACSYL